MANEFGELQAKLDDLVRSVAGLERRLEVVETRLRVEGPPPSRETVEESGAKEPGAIALDLGAGAALLGRTLLVLGGGYLIRALTEAETLPPATGVLLGLIYAALWIGLSGRAATRNRRPSAAFHALGAGLVAYPLVWESTVRFGILTTVLAAVVLAVLTSGFLVVAWRHYLAAAAWVGAAGAAGAGLALQVTTGSFEPSAVLLLLLGVGVLWLARTREWPGLAGVTAVVADFAVLVVGTGALSKGATVHRGLALVILLGLFVLYVGSFLIAILRQGRRAGFFEPLQVGLVTLVGLGGASWVALEMDPAVTVALGVGALTTGVAGYALILLHPLFAEDRKLDFLLYASLAWILAGAGVGITFSVPAVGWSLLGLIAALLATRLAGSVLQLHGAFFLLLSAIAGGLLHQSFVAMAASFDGALVLFTAVHGTILLVTALCVILPIAGMGSPERGSVRWVRTALVVLLVLGAGGLAISTFEPLTRVEGVVDPARLATLRTGVLALLTLLTAAASRLQRLRVAEDLVYPLLIAGGLKLLVEDFFVESPRHLVIALPLYAAALILAPRIRGSDVTATDQTD